MRSSPLSNRSSRRLGINGITRYFPLYSSGATLSHSPTSIQLQRRIHYAQHAQVAASAGKPPDGHPLGGAPPPPPATFAAAVELGDAQAAGHPHPHPYPTADPNQQQQQQQQQQRPPPPPPPQNDFRERFHRSLVAPSPFGTFAPPP